MRSPTQTKTTPKPSFTSVQIGLLQRQCACGNSASLTGKCSECENKRLTLQRRSTNQTEPSEVPPIVHEVLRSPGRPLDPDTRTFMESRFGHDFSQVRVHTNTNAAESARTVSALAYTVGQDVVFNTGQYAPETNKGKRILAHELAHVVQQDYRSASRPSSLAVAPHQSAFETEADTAARAVVSSISAPTLVPPLSGAFLTLQRQISDPPHKLVPLSENPAEKHTASDAIVTDFRAAANEVKARTMIDLTEEPGDTLRPMASKTAKSGASNFSWHKTGRAIDLNQSHQWVIVKEPAGDKMQFRIFLEKKDAEESSYERTFSEEENTDFHVNPYGKNIFKKKFIDISQVLIERGFSRISAQAGWEKTYNKQEWWHYEKRDNKTMYQALQDIYREEDIVSGYSSLVTNKKTGKAPVKSLVRLHEEGFPYDTIQKISPKTDNAEREIELSKAHSALTPKKEKEKNYTQAALYLNGLNEPDIKRELGKLKKEVIRKIHEVSASHPGLGVGSNIYKLTDGI